MHLWGRGVLEEACLEMRNVRGWDLRADVREAGVGGFERGWAWVRWRGRGRGRYGWGMNGVGGRTWFD